MKKLITTLSLLLAFTISIQADILKLKTTSSSFKTYYPLTQTWSNWSEWKECSILVVINTETDIIKIYSKETQDYDIIKYGAEESDGEGGIVRTLYCVNENGARCNIRFRSTAANDYQLYIDFNDAIIAYNLIER